MRESVLTSVLFTLTFPPPHCRGKEREGGGGKADSAKPSQAILLKGERREGGDSGECRQCN